MPVVKPISDQTRALTTIQEREDHIQPTQVASPPCNHPVNHSGVVEFYRDAVAPGAPLC